MTRITLRVIVSSAVAACFLLVALVANAQTEIETNGMPFEGSITRDGKEIATISFYGEGTTKIRFDGNQNLILKDSNGNVVAGFEVVAVDPKAAKPTQLYLYSYKDESKSKTLAMEHHIVLVAFRKGQYKIEGADENLLTSFYSGEKQLSVFFKHVTHQKTSEGQVMNLLTISSPEGEEFVFSMEPSSSMICQLTTYKSDIVKYLKKKRNDLKVKSQ